jgi:phosphoglycolate phosphatase
VIPGDAELLLCDLDGTLVDSFEDIRAGIIVALRAIDVEPTDPLLALCRQGVALEGFYQRATGVAPVGDQAPRYQRFVDAYLTAYAAGPSRARVYEGVPETLAALRRRSLPIAVATSKRTHMARAVLDRAHLTRLVDVICGSEDLPKKPDPAVLRRAAARAGRPLGAAVMVGDTDKDVGAARTAGCYAVAVTYGGGTAAELGAAGPDRTIDAFAELLDLLG